LRTCVQPSLTRADNAAFQCLPFQALHDIRVFFVKLGNRSERFRLEAIEEDPLNAPLGSSKKNQLGWHMRCLRKALSRNTCPQQKSCVFAENLMCTPHVCLTPRAAKNPDASPEKHFPTKCTAPRKPPPGVFTRYIGAKMWRPPHGLCSYEECAEKL